MNKVLVIFVVLLFFCNGASYGEDNDSKGLITKKKTELNRIKKNINEKVKRVEAYGKRELLVLSKLNSIEKVLSHNAAEIHSIEDNIEDVKEKIIDINEQISKIDEDMEVIHSKLEPHLIVLYKLGETGLSRALLSRCSYDDISRTRRSINMILRRDLEMMKKHKNDLLLLSKKKKELKEEEEELALLKENYESQKSEIKKEIFRKSGILKILQRKKDADLTQLKKLKGNSKNLQSMIGKLDRERSKTAKKSKSVDKRYGFAALMGKLDAPVSGKILPLFGKQENPILNTFTFGKGIDILAPMGSEIKAVYNGEVLYSDWFKGYGKIIIIDHGNSYYTLIAHASKLLKRVGDRVRKGEVIALVGDTDSVKGPHLYFEIRHHGKPQDPVKWLAMPVAR
ncbi:MAG: peptidoglycan DD-metalloendopeptidase family protein [Thermodesulfobacteriota bacterium]|nr:peptidoglycan DD-metalloendopeptidase family protein [Thermodesulfobacteriota bacterium]